MLNNKNIESIDKSISMLAELKDINPVAFPDIKEIEVLIERILLKYKKGI